MGYMGGGGGADQPLKKDLSSFVVHAFQFGFLLRPDELGDHRRWLPRNRFAVSFVFLIGDLIPFPREGLLFRHTEDLPETFSRMSSSSVSLVRFWMVIIPASLSS